MRIINYTPEFGRMFHEVAKAAIQFARKNVCRDMTPIAASFKFNDIDIIARSDSSDYDVCLQYDLKCRIRRLELGHKD